MIALGDACFILLINKLINQKLHIELLGQDVRDAKKGTPDSQCPPPWQFMSWMQIKKKKSAP